MVLLAFIKTKKLKLISYQQMIQVCWKLSDRGKFKQYYHSIIVPLSDIKSWGCVNLFVQKNDEMMNLKRLRGSCNFVLVLRNRALSFFRLLLYLCNDYFLLAFKLFYLDTDLQFKPQYQEVHVFCFGQTKLI